MTHTKGPWEAIAHVQLNFNDYFSIVAPSPNDGLQDTICYVNGKGLFNATPETVKANAARIVACVNALEGMNPEGLKPLIEKLEGMVGDGPWMMLMQDAKELLAKLREVA